MRAEYHTELERAANERHRMKEIDILNDRREDKNVSFHIMNTLYIILYIVNVYIIFNMYYILIYIL